MTHRLIHTRRGRRLAAGLAVVATGALLGACSSLLDVKNPNNVGADALDHPEASAAIVTGAENSLARAMAGIYNPYAVSTDETFWVGSRDAYLVLDNGSLSDPNNEYINSAFFNIGEARWLGEQAIAKLSKFNAAGTLQDKTLLVRAYLDGATMYTTLADMFNDMTFSDRTIAGPNIGEANMVTLYDSATKWLTAARALASGDQLIQVTGMLARVKHAKGEWQLVNASKGTKPAGPLVADGSLGYKADAQAAAALMSGDYRYEINTTDNNRGDNSGGGFGFEMNTRGEQTPDTANTWPYRLAAIDPSNNKPKETLGKDPVTGLVDASLDLNMFRIINAGNNVPMMQASRREVLLLLAEAALAAGDNAGFDSNINTLRAIDGKAAFTGTLLIPDPKQANPRIALLEWERRVNLIFQGRRLADMYRFGTVDPRWSATSAAVRQVGCRFAIPISEIQSNSAVKNAPICKF